MKTPESKLDSAAVFAAAYSLWEACNKAQQANPSINLSDAYSGYDQLMREVMRIGDLFETWACDNVDFEAFSEVWPYLLGNRFGKTCLGLISPTNLSSFNADDCLHIALRLFLPIKSSSALRVPIDLVIPNPAVSSEFKYFRIQTVRENNENQTCPFTVNDDPFDDEFGSPFFGIYGIEADGTLEHIADRADFQSTAELLRKLAPGIMLPEAPVSSTDEIKFLAGERDFEDATTIEEYVVPVDLHPDGSITDEDGNTFPNDSW
jgi:hypothetical protein